MGSSQGAPMRMARNAAWRRWTVELDCIFEFELIREHMMPVALRADLLRICTTAVGSDCDQEVRMYLAGTSAEDQ